jgi:hypothetical protein
MVVLRIFQELNAVGLFAHDASRKIRFGANESFSSQATGTP